MDRELKIYPRNLNPLRWRGGRLSVAVARRFTRQLFIYYARFRNLRLIKAQYRSVNRFLSSLFLNQKARDNTRRIEIISARKKSSLIINLIILIIRYCSVIKISSVTRISKRQVNPFFYNSRVVSRVDGSKGEVVTAQFVGVGAQ